MMRDFAMEDSRDDVCVCVYVQYNVETASHVHCCFCIEHVVVVVVVNKSHVTPPLVLDTVDEGT